MLPSGMVNRALIDGASLRCCLSDGMRSSIKSLSGRKVPLLPCRNTCCAVIEPCGMRMSGRSPDASIRLNFSCDPFDSIISMKSTCTLVRSSR